MRALHLMRVSEYAGDAVGTDDIVLQIETDKVTVDVRYTTGKPGKLKEMLVKEEDTVAVGQKVAVVAEGEEGSQSEEKEVTHLLGVGWAELGTVVCQLWVNNNVLITNPDLFSTPAVHGLQRPPHT